MMTSYPFHEQNAMQDFQALLGDTDTAREIVALWQEYEDASTKEALLVKDLDKFEMIVQALEYEKCKSGPDKPLLCFRNIHRHQPTTNRYRASLTPPRASSTTPPSRPGRKHFMPSGLPFEDIDDPTNKSYI